MLNRGIDIGFCWDQGECLPEEGLHRLKSCGFEGIELWGRWIDRFGLDQWAIALKATGMNCFQLCPYFDLVHGLEGIERSRIELDLYLGYARALNCSRLRTFTGPVPPEGRAPGDGAINGREASEDQWREAIISLCQFCDLAAEQHVELCLECHEGMLSEDSSGTIRLLSEVRRSNLTVNLQLPLRNEEWEKSIEILGMHTTHMHVHNWQGARDMGHLTFLSEGEFDWFPVLERLVCGLGRRVCASIEHADHIGKRSPWESAERDGAYLQALRSRVMNVI